MTNKRNNMIYWVFTLLVLLPCAGQGIPELLTSGPESVIRTFQSLGYPLYLMKILGLAKILGAVAIISNKSPKLKEWAYAGFGFDFLGATASHALAGNTAQAPFPFIFFLFLVGSYVFNQKRQASLLN